jgi:uncharacterized protein YqeY
MSKREEFSAAMKEALKSKDQVALSTIRLITAALKDRDIAARSTGNTEGIAEGEILSMLQSMIKQRQESSKTYRDAGRPELADREDQEITIINRFLPAQLSEDEVGKAIDSVIVAIGAKDIKDMGRVMADLKTRYAGQMDMAKVGGLVKQKLSA